LFKKRVFYVRQTSFDEREKAKIANLTRKISQTPKGCRFGPAYAETSYPAGYCTLRSVTLIRVRLRATAVDNWPWLLLYLGFRSG